MKLEDVILEAVKTGGTYVAVSLDPDDAKKLFDYYAKFNVPDMLDVDDYHITIAYSSKKFEPVLIKDLSDVPAVIPEEHKIFTGKSDKNCLVLVVKSEWLYDQFDKCTELGAKFDYDKYSPHITISYDIGDFDIKKVKLPTIKAKLAKHYTEELVLNKYE